MKLKNSYSKIWDINIMLTSSSNADSKLFEQISQLLPHVPESVLQEVWMILSTAAKKEASYSDLETNPIVDRTAFLNGYAIEDEGLYDEY
jgi:hypothetical protein